MAFDESKIVRDERGRFAEGPPGGAKEPKEALVFKSGPGKLSDWAGRGLPRSTEAKKPTGSWDASKARFGPLAGKLSAARYGAAQQKTLFPESEPQLNEGSHFLKQSVGDPFGKRQEGYDPTETIARETTLDHARDTHDASEAVRQATADIAKKFPNVADYLRKNPLTEVQARRAYAEWQVGLPEGVDPDHIKPDTKLSQGYQFQPIGGAYVKKGVDPDARQLDFGARAGIRPPGKFDAGQKPGDMSLMLNRYQPGHEDVHDPTRKDTPGPAEEQRWPVALRQLNQPMYDRSGNTKAPSTISLAADNERDYAVSTMLHEIGHHVMLGDDARDEAKPAGGAYRTRTQAGLPGSGLKEKTEWGISKGMKVKQVINDAYDKDRERSIRGIPDPRDSSGIERKEISPFTSYASTSPAEWFAEAFAAFHVRPDYLKQASPIAYKTVKTVMKMRKIQYPDVVRRGTPPLYAWANSKRKSEKEI